MGLEKFMDDGLGKKNIDKSENIHIPNKDYKNIADKAILDAFHKTDPFSIPEKKSPERAPMTIYFEKEYLDILKALAYTKKRTVNEVLMLTLENLFSNTEFPKDFDVKALSKQYDDTIKKVGLNKNNNNME